MMMTYITEQIYYGRAGYLRKIPVERRQMDMKHPNFHLEASWSHLSLFSKSWSYPFDMQYS